MFAKTHTHIHRHIHLQFTVAHIKIDTQMKKRDMPGTSINCMCVGQQ